MTIDDLRREVDEFWDTVYEEGLEMKDAYSPLFRLNELYKRLDESERSSVDQILAEWLLSEREDKRFAAMSLISDFRIRSARDALAELVDRLAKSSDPGAPFECEKAARIIGELAITNG